MVLLMETRPLEALPEPTMVANIGMTTNIIASASRANRGTIIRTRFSLTACPAIQITLLFGCKEAEGEIQRMAYRCKAEESSPAVSLQLRLLLTLILLSLPLNKGFLNKQLKFRPFS